MKRLAYVLVPLILLPGVGSAKPPAAVYTVGKPPPPVIRPVAKKVRTWRAPRPAKAHLIVPTIYAGHDHNGLVPQAEKQGGCAILKKSDPEDEMAYMLWSAYIGSPRHATRPLWNQYDNQPVFFRMAQFALSICGPVELTAQKE
jgi:hypothetical protein